MSRTLVIVLVVIAFGAGVGAGVLGILWATGGTSEPSQDINEVAPTLSLDGPTPTPGAANQLGTAIAQINTQLGDLVAQSLSINNRLDSLSTAVSGDSIPSAVATTTPTADPADSVDEEPAEETTPEASIEAQRALFRITQDDSEVRFKIDEILIGNPTTVVGTTQQVAGDVIVNYTDPAASQMGTIAINARTLKTDNEFRDQSIRGQILKSSQADFEFIEFVPTELIGLPNAPASVGDTFEFQIVGDLTVTGVTREVTFDATVTLTAEDRIEGLATTEILYPDFGISINAPPNVTGISDNVILEIEFVATQVES